MILIVCLIRIANKPKSQNVYADSINFTPTAGTIEIYKENTLLVDSNMVKITPSNCTYSPEFTLRRYGESKDEAEVIKSGKLSFTYSGIYILDCRVLSSEKYFAEDSLIITVADNPNSATTLYTKKLAPQILYVADTIPIYSLAEIVYPKYGNLNVNCSEHLSFNNGILTALKSGVGVIEVILTYDNFKVCETFGVTIKPKLVESDINLILSVKGEIITDNTIEITYSPLNCSINYEIINIEGNQTINCWTNSNIIQVISFDIPTIVLKPLDVGEAIIYVSPTAYPDMIFEILIIIN